MGHEEDMDRLLEAVRSLPDPPQDKPRPVFAHLSAETRAWLTDLRADDIAEIKEALRFYRSSRTIGRFGRWAIVTFVTIFVGVVAFGEKIGVAWKWITGGPR